MVQVEKLAPDLFQILLNGIRSCYLVMDRRTALIDCGFPSEVPDLVRGLKQVGLEPRDLDLLLLTHVHVDHAGGAGYLAKERPGLQIRVHAKGLPHLLRPERLNASVKRAYGERFQEVGTLLPVDPGQSEVTEINTGDEIDVGQTRLKVLETPGHATHHVVFYDEEHRVFAGDALGSKYAGLPNFVLAPPPDYDPERSRESIRRIRELNPRVLFFTHNGPYYLAERDDFFDALMRRHRVWLETLSEIVAAQPDLDREEILERFLERRRELRPYASSQRFSFGLTVAGMVKYLKDNGEA